MAMIQVPVSLFKTADFKVWIQIWFFQNFWTFYLGIRENLAVFVHFVHIGTGRQVFPILNFLLTQERSKNCYSWLPELLANLVILLVASNSSVFLNYYLRRKKVIHVLKKKKQTSEKRGEKQSLSPGDESYTLIWAEVHRVKITKLNANQQEDD